MSNTIFVAALNDNRDPQSLGLQGIRDHYESFAGLDRMQDLSLPWLDLLVLTHDSPSRRWPSVSRGTDGTWLITPYAPVGIERIIAQPWRTDAPQRLSRALLEDPRLIDRLIPPFCAVIVDPAVERLTVLTDQLGIARVFESTAAGPLVLSNRPAAPHLYRGGRPPLLSSNGWKSQAATDWWLGHTTPFADVQSLPASAHVELTPTGITHRKGPTVLSRWIASDRPDGWRRARKEVRDTAESLTQTALSVASNWDGPIDVDLSGGRDSRLVAAAFLAAGVPVTFHTHDRTPGEVEVARDLLARLPAKQRPEHRIDHAPITAGHTPDAIPQALGWHRFAEGLRPSAYLWHSPPSSLADDRSVIVGGAGGEVAHDFYYTNSDLVVPRDAQDVAAWATSRLISRTVWKGGVTRKAQAFAERQIRRDVDKAFKAGLRDESILDYFYVHERLRRWSMAGESDRIASPLLSPGFQSAAMRLTPAERLMATLPRRIIEKLVPKWRDIPFFHGDPARPPTLIRAGQAPDRQALEHFMTNRNGWTEFFSPKRVEKAWQDSTNGQSANIQEVLLRRWIWHTTFASTFEGAAPHG